MAVLLTAIFIHSCEGVGVDIPHCTIPVNLEVTTEWNSVIGQSSGGLIVEATRGNGGYEYSLNDGPFQTLGEFTDLAAGDYTVTGRDRQGCTNTITVTIEEIEVPSLANEVMPIFENHCNSNFCHGSTRPRSFEMLSYSDIAPHVQTIKVTVIDRTMPPRFRTVLTNDEISAIVSWVDGGAPNN